MSGCVTGVGVGIGREVRSVQGMDVLSVVRVGEDEDWAIASETTTEPIAPSD